MVYCYRCGLENPDGANYCNKCAASLASDHEFEDSVRKLADKTAKFGKAVAREAHAIAGEVAKRVAAKPLPCPKCGERIYETDVFCWKCGEKRE